MGTLIPSHASPISPNTQFWPILLVPLRGGPFNTSLRTHFASVAHHVPLHAFFCTPDPFLLSGCKLDPTGTFQSATCPFNSPGALLCSPLDASLREAISRLSPGMFCHFCPPPARQCFQPPPMPFYISPDAN